jgi:hypothetical protein
MFATAGANAFANEMLRYNPFEQPEMSDVKRGKPGAKTAAASMELRGTVVDGKDSLANIDGDYYRLNYEVSGYRVVRIDNGSVTLSRGDNETVLTLHDDE